MRRECARSPHSRCHVSVVRKGDQGASPHLGAHGNSNHFAVDLATDSTFGSAARDHSVDSCQKRKNWLCRDFKEMGIVPIHCLSEMSADGEVAGGQDNKKLDGRSITGTFAGAWESRCLTSAGVTRRMTSSALLPWKSSGPHRGHGELRQCRVAPTRGAEERGSRSRVPVGHGRHRRPPGHIRLRGTMGTHADSAAPSAGRSLQLSLCSLGATRASVPMLQRQRPSPTGRPMARCLRVVRQRITAIVPSDSIIHRPVASPVTIGSSATPGLMGVATWPNLIPRQVTGRFRCLSPFGRPVHPRSGPSSELITFTLLQPISIQGEISPPLTFQRLPRQVSVISTLAFPPNVSQPMIDLRYRHHPQYEYELHNAGRSWVS
jgi:hypothetical protein